MDKKLPPFKGPDWPTLPPAAVAWAVDVNGHVYSYLFLPHASGECWMPFSAICRQHDRVDLGDIDWRNTLHVRPIVTAQIDPKAGRETQGFVDSAELERLAEVAWKGMMNLSGGNEALALAAFKRAEAFIAVRNRRREA